MQHLDTERIAAFDHDPPTDGEVAHLAACNACRRERSALVELSQMAMNLVDAPTPSNEPRLSNWENLSTRLRAEGLITSAPSTVRYSETENSAAIPFDVRVTATSDINWLSRATPRTRPEWWRAAAAALIFVIGGAGLGRISAGASFMPLVAQGSGQNTADVIPGSGLGGGGYSSLGEANRALARAQSDAQRASLWLAANDSTVNSTEMVRRRLAALDQMLAASREGLVAAPQDPVLKSYYSAAYTAREVTLQQLGGALSVGRSLERY